jgi:hypothetical protein
MRSQDHYLNAHSSCQHGVLKSCRLYLTRKPASKEIKTACILDRQTNMLTQTDADRKFIDLIQDTTGTEGSQRQIIHGANQS